MVTFKALSINLLLLLVLLCQADAQPSNSPGTEDQFRYPSVSPAMAIIIVILIAALFFIAFFSIYIRNRSAANGSIRQTFSMRRRTAAATRGLENSVIETFPTFTYVEVKDHHIGKGALECAVCLNEFEDNEMLRLIPKCDHVFHPECIDAWLQSHVTCPVCRADLTPKPDEPAPVQAPEVNRELGQEHGETENLQQNNEVSIQIEGDENLMSQHQESSVRPEVKTNLSFNASNRPPRSFSVKRPKMFSKFRSHSTGHSLVVPGENLDRYTLRLPENVRKDVLNRALLNRTRSCAVTLPRHGSTTRGYRAGPGEGSNRGARSLKRIDRFDPEAKSDRWVFKIAPPFFSRGPSMKSPKVGADNEEASTSRSNVKMAVKMPSFKCLEPKGDEPGLLAHDSARSPV
ncbi:E3 ubiquitin-protein ligase ATL31-like [Solanum dulcamara]|uniref:E3 ubiquitin-protein ligase ATL31-like n=1 Tax=Solanum dulcamara TaxID=45834 RepID=UPI0024869FBC|nr:E3 ubiquitin-protein ligase ATL31-like [Solanum dulcamara]